MKKCDIPVKNNILPEKPQIFEGENDRQEKKVIDIREILIQIQKGTSQRRIAELLGVNRRIVKKYKEWAEAHQLLTVASSCFCQ